MDEIERRAEAAGDALLAMAEGPGQAAADALEAAFGAAGERIEAALGRAAKTGELDFERMAEAILRDLARVAAEALIAGGQGQTAGGRNVNLTMNVGADDGAAGVSRAGVSSLLARLVTESGRFA